MKKATKLLALVLALVLIIGAIPVQAAETISLKKSSKILYLGGCIGKKANGKKASYYSFVKIKKLLKGFDSKTMDVKLEAEDPSIVSVSNKTCKATAKKRGETEVVIIVRNKKDETTIATKILSVTVKKNADKNFEVSGIADGKEYKTGDTITVKMPRTADDDYRRLTCSSSNVTLKKTGSYGTEYKVTFDKAGTYTIKAETYQTSTYKGTIYSKSFNVTVKGEDKPEPTVTPTPNPVDSKLSAKQTALNEVVVSGFDKPADIKASDLEIFFYYENVDVPMDYSYIDSVSVDGDKLVIKMLTNFTSNCEFNIRRKGSTDEPAKFKAISATEKDIASVGITTNKVLVDSLTDLGIRYYNKDKIDITAAVSGKVFPSINLVGDATDAYASGTSVCILTANVARKFEVSVFTYTDDLGTPKYVKNEFAVVSYVPVPQGFIYTIKEDKGTYMKETDTLSSSFTYDASAPVIEALFKYVDATGKTSYRNLTDEGITKIKAANETILFVGGQSPTGGFYLTPNKTGSTDLIFYKGDNVVPGISAKVTVLGESKASSVSATLSKATLNVNSAIGDKLEIKVTVKDQYGKEIKGQPITIEQTEATKNSTGVAHFGSFVDGVLVVNGADIILNSGRKQGTIGATIKSGSGQYPITFSVADMDTANVAVLTSNPETSAITLNTAIKEGDVKPGTYSISIQSKNGAYTIKNEVMRLYGKQVANPIKSSDLGVADGETVYLYTIRYTGSDNQTKFLSTFPACITNGVTEVIFAAYDHGVRLEAGSYIIQAYKVVAGANNSNITSIGTKTINVVNDKPQIAYKQVKFESAMHDPVDVVKDCFEFYIDGKKVESPVISVADMNSSVDGTKFVKSANLVINNTVYGDYEFTISMLESKTIK